MDVSSPGGEFSFSVVDPGGLSPGYAHQPGGGGSSPGGYSLGGFSPGVNLQGGILRAPNFL